MLPHECTKLYPTVFCNVGHPKMLRRALRRLRPDGRLVIRGRELMPLLMQLFASVEARETITGSVFSIAKGYRPILRPLRQLDAVALVWEPPGEPSIETWTPSESLSYSEVAWLAARQI
jgi:D-arabinose 1-dehydrogenase-like Zn-dependent alcohol dehydrogenase